MSIPSREKENPIKELLQQHEEKMRAVDNRIKGISFRDVDTSVGMFLNQPLLALNVKIKDKEEFENVLRTVEKISQNKNEIWKIQSDFYDKFVENIILPNYFKFSETSKEYLNCFDDKNIMDFTISSHSFCYLDKVCIIIKEQLLYSTLKYIISSDKCPDILKNINPDFLSVKTPTASRYFKFNQYIKSLEKVRDGFKLSPLEFSSLTANSLFINGFQNYPDTSFKSLQKFLEENDVLNRITTLPGIDKNIFDMCYAKNFNYFSVLAGKEQAELFGRGILNEKLWKSYDEIKYYSDFYMDCIIEYVINAGKTLDNEEERFKEFYNNFINSINIDYIKSQLEEEEETINKQYCIENKDDTFIKPKIVDSYDIVKNIESFKKDLDIGTCLSQAGGNVIDKNSYSKEPDSSNLFESKLNFFQPLSHSFEDKNEIMTEAYLAAVFPSISESIIDKLLYKVKDDEILPETIQKFNDYYLKAGGDYSVSVDLMKNLKN